MSLSDMQSRIAVLISADAGGAIREIKKVGEAADKDLGKATDKIDKLGNRLTYGGAAAMGFAAMAGGALYSFAQAAAEAQQAELKLQNSMQNSPVLANTNIEVFKKLATSIQGKTAADGDMILSSMSVLAQFRLTESQIKTVTPLVVDFARKMGVDLDTAAKSVGKALDGKATALQKAGIKIDENVYKTDRLKAVTDGLRSSVGGFAEQEGQTFSGKLERLQNQMGDLKESIGAGVITTIGPLMNSLGKLAQGASEVDEKTGGMVGSISSIAVGVTGAVGALSFLSGTFIKLRQQIQLTEGGMTKFGVGAIAIAGVGISAAFQDMVNSLVDSTNTVTINMRQLRDEMNFFAESGKLTGGLQKQISAFEDLGHQVRMTADGGYRAARSMELPVTGLAGWHNAKNSVLALGYAFDNLQHGKFQIIDSFNIWSDSAGTSKKKIDALNQSLVDMVQAGKGDAAARLFADISKSAKAGGASQKDLNAAFKDYIAAADTAAKSTAGHNKLIEDSTNDLSAEAQARRWGNIQLEDRVNLLGRLADGSLNVEMGQLRLEDAMADYNKKVAEGTFKGNELREAQIQLVLQASDLALKTGELQAAQEGFTDAGEKDTRARAIQIQSLEAMKLKFPELASQIDAHIQKLNTVPGSVDTKVNVHTDDMIHALEDARSRFDRLMSHIRNEGAEVNFHINGGGGVSFRAAGGPIVAGRAYVVGERGPELIVPNANGSVIPNNALRSYNPGGGGTYNVTVNVSAGTHPATVGAEVVNAIKAYERRNGQGWRN